MKEKICFFSHNWSDGKDDYKKLLKEKIRRLSNSEIKVIYDKDDFAIADNLDDKENIIFEATTVVLFLSPAYKKSVDSGDPSKGSYREYEKIIKRLSDDKGFLIPILIAGNLESAVPNELKNIVYQDSSNNTVVYDEKINSFSSNDEEAIEKLARIIIDITNLIYKINSENFSSSIEKVNELIHNKHSKNTLPKSCMILIDAYNRIIKQESFVFSGRKGSGKTTLIELIEKYDYKQFANMYKTLYPISFDRMNVEALYDSYTNIGKTSGRLFAQYDIIRIFWELFLIFSSMIVLCKEYENGRITDKIQSNDFVQVYEKLRNIIKVNSFKDFSTEGVFSLANTSMKKRYEIIYEQYKDNINLDTILVANLNSFNIARTMVGAKIFDAFEKVLNRCQKKIMIFIDGFNSDSETFKVITKALPSSKDEEKNKRNMFETDLYKGLINVVTEIKEEKRSELFKNVHFCIVFPEDRIEQIRLSDRDFIKKNVSNLRWDGILLANMVNKRLLAINEFNDCPLDPFDLFRDYMKKFYPGIPSSYKFRLKNKEIEVDLFIYFLSLSFWRPRDILVHLSILIAAIEDETFLMSSTTLRTLLYNSSEQIIKDEFCKEYQNVIYNLEDIINAFKNKNIILNPSECYDILKSLPFQLTSENPIVSFKDKLKFLYEIGFIGIVLPINVKEQYERQTEYCFYYNEGMKPFEYINFDGNFGNFKFVINHLFYNYLNLKYNSDSFIEGFTKDYLISNHQLRNLIISY